MNAKGQPSAGCGYAVQGQPAPMLEVALHALRRAGSVPQALPACNGSTCAWVRDIAECLSRQTCRAAVLFCDDPELACCLANKIAGIRAASVSSVAQANRALEDLGANLLIMEMAGRTYFEFKALLALVGSATCPPGIACALTELDGHAHR
jgi:hypothetical protein